MFFSVPPLGVFFVLFGIASDLFHFFCVCVLHIGVVVMCCCVVCFFFIFLLRFSIFLLDCFSTSFFQVFFCSSFFFFFSFVCGCVNIYSVVCVQSIGRVGDVL